MGEQTFLGRIKPSKITITIFIILVSVGLLLWNLITILKKDYDIAFGLEAKTAEEIEEEEHKVKCESYAKKFGTICECNLVDGQLTETRAECNKCNPLDPTDVDGVNCCNSPQLKECITDDDCFEENETCNRVPIKQSTWILGYAPSRCFNPTEPGYENISPNGCVGGNDILRPVGNGLCCGPSDDAVVYDRTRHEAFSALELASEIAPSLVQDYITDSIAQMFFDTGTWEGEAGSQTLVEGGFEAGLIQNVERAAARNAMQDAFAGSVRRIFIRSIGRIFVKFGCMIANPTPSKIIMLVTLVYDMTKLLDIFDLSNYTNFNTNLTLKTNLRDKSEEAFIELLSGFGPSSQTGSAGVALDSYMTPPFIFNLHAFETGWPKHQTDTGGTSADGTSADGTSTGPVLPPISDSDWQNFVEPMKKIYESYKRGLGNFHEDEFSNFRNTPGPSGRTISEEIVSEIIAGTVDYTDNTTLDQHIGAAFIEYENTHLNDPDKAISRDEYIWGYMFSDPLVNDNAINTYLVFEKNFSAPNKSGITLSKDGCDLWNRFRKPLSFASIHSNSYRVLEGGIIKNKMIGEDSDSCKNDLCEILDQDSSEACSCPSRKTSGEKGCPITQFYPPSLQEQIENICNYGWGEGRPKEDETDAEFKTRIEKLANGESGTEDVDRDDLMIPKDYGVTYNQNTGLCNFTPEYCGRATGSSDNFKCVNVDTIDDYSQMPPRRAREDTRTLSETLNGCPRHCPPQPTPRGPRIELFDNQTEYENDNFRKLYQLDGTVYTECSIGYEQQEDEENHGRFVTRGIERTWESIADSGPGRALGSFTRKLDQHHLDKFENNLVSLFSF
jgi:hypothetical protein